MESKVAASSVTPDPTFGQSPPTSRPPRGASADRGARTTDPVDLRLVIEEDKATGSYIYKTVNRVTGEVVQQLPREQLLKLREDTEYVAGTVIRSEA